MLLPENDDCTCVWACACVCLFVCVRENVCEFVFVRLCVFVCLCEFVSACVCDNLCVHVLCVSIFPGVRLNKSVTKTRLEHRIENTVNILQTHVLGLRKSLETSHLIIKDKDAKDAVIMKNDAVITKLQARLYFSVFEACKHIDA